jgi:hypothetical protein
LSLSSWVSQLVLVLVVLPLSLLVLVVTFSNSLHALLLLPLLPGGASGVPVEAMFRLFFSRAFFSRACTGAPLLQRVHTLRAHALTSATEFLKRALCADDTNNAC